MARSVFFRVRGRKRSKQKQYKFKKVIFLLLAMLFVLTGVRYFSRPAVVPAMATVVAEEEETTGSLPQALYLRMLAQVIPGFEPDPPQKAEGESGAVLEEKKTTRLSDLSDPKNLISSQIPFMVDAELEKQPQVNNVPMRQNDPEEEETPRIVIPLRQTLSGEGKVIIYHVHTTESFVPTSGKTFTEDLTKTVAQLGSELGDLMRSQYNIPVIHNDKIHDIPRTGSYERALPTIKGLLEQNPDADLVIDLHRDGVARNVTTTEIDGQSVGRILFVVGSRHPEWQENNRKAQFLHKQLEEMAPGISRGVRERPLVYNQHVHPGSLLIEVGGHENSLEEARRALPYLARALAELYNSGN
ncbi:stage II sporulation protein P [Dethiobacter alkaliphilus]|uniref:stage II sporulation protein P n=1 Tax=Dethiobacter alkaliphilus TaxID=427926 RepID=UPI0022274C3E|nr:stage II sporulation protein P [Dethiobacter alkaliphilus]MCW3489313.1 stage II sporulation protein P [Dethiobacter alkaliphilus]